MIDTDITEDLWRRRPRFYPHFVRNVGSFLTSVREKFAPRRVKSVANRTNILLPVKELSCLMIIPKLHTGVCMIDAVNIARTALHAQGVNASVIADNIANANTPAYEPKQVTMIPMNPGVAVGPIVASAQASVDLGSELVNMVVAAKAYEAAAKVAHVSDQMMHSLLEAI